MTATKQRNTIIRKRATRLGTLTPAKAKLMQEKLSEEQGSLSKEKAKELDMVRCTYHIDQSFYVYIYNLHTFQRFMLIIPRRIHTGSCLCQVP